MKADGTMRAKRDLTAMARILVIPLVLVVYVATLVRNQSESASRVLSIVQPVTEKDRVVVLISIVGVDIAASETRARLRFRLAGTIARDEVTPAVDLKLLLNTSRGQQAEYTLSARSRVNPIEAVFALAGDSNHYPFDVHQTRVEILMTRPARARRASTRPARPPEGQQAPPSEQGQDAADDAGLTTSELIVGTAALETREPVPVFIDLAASIPGIRFAGDVTGSTGEGVTQVNLTMRRTRNVIIVSVATMVMMMILAISLLAMVLRVTVAGNESALLPLSLSVSLIFGLPALRNAQPGVPPVGALGDYFSFLWAEFIVAASTVAMIWTWILRSRHPKMQAPHNEGASPSGPGPEAG